jgi:hypothetical protein
MPAHAFARAFFWLRFGNERVETNVLKRMR